MPRTKPKKQREHELQIAIIKAFAADPTLKYWVACGVGAGATAVISMFSETSNSGSTPNDIAKRGIMDYVGLVVGGAGGVAITEALQTFQTSAKDNPFGSLLGMTATWTGLNAACLVLSSMSGGGDSAGLLGKLGAAVAI